MAVDTYDELKADIMDMLQRDDINNIVTVAGISIDSAVERAIAKCEIRLQRSLRIRQMETSTAVTFTAALTTYTLPSDFLSARLFILNTTPITILRQDSLENIYAEFPNNFTARPLSFTVTGLNYEVRPPPDTAYTGVLTYYKTIPVLSTASPTNYLLTLCPDLYLYGSCLELAPWLQDDERIQVWKGAFDEGLRQLTDDDDAAKWSGVLVRAALPVQIVV